MAEQPTLPSWRYHVSGEARIIETADELKALAPGEWFESAEAAQQAAQTAAEATATRTTRRTSSGHSAPDE